jgi:hypothetical protein
MIEFGFEGIFSYFESGEFETDSTAKLKSMIVWPEEPRTWIIGDGYFENSRNDINYLGDATVEGFYMGTDIGYLRFIFYFGIIGLIAISLVVIYSGLIGIKYYPEYKNLFERENKKWKRYYDVVNKVAGFMDLGSGSPLYINELVNLSIRLREISLQPMILHAQGTKVYFSRTVFTSAMIEEAYEAFIKVEDKNEDLEGIDDYLNLLVKEQQCWNDWMAYRESIAAELPSDLKRFYDNCTNMVRREKLLQLKNQYQGLGMTSSEVWSCVLPDSCSDRALLEYPGFDVVWAKHLQDPDCYPSFHSEESVIETMIKSFEEDSYTEEEAAHWDSMNN